MDNCYIQRGPMNPSMHLFNPPSFNTLYTTKSWIRIGYFGIPSLIPRVSSFVSPHDHTHDRLLYVLLELLSIVLFDVFGAAATERDDLF